MYFRLSKFSFCSWDFCLSVLVHRSSSPFSAPTDILPLHYEAVQLQNRNIFPNLCKCVGGLINIQLLGGKVADEYYKSTRCMNEKTRFQCTDRIYKQVHTNSVGQGWLLVFPLLPTEQFGSLSSIQNKTHTHIQHRHVDTFWGQVVRSNRLLFLGNS